MSTFSALCHFCEVHGPCVVMVSQGWREVRWSASTRRTHWDAPPPPHPAGAAHDSSTPVPDLLAAPTLMQDIRNSPRRAGCEGCWSLGPARGAIVSSNTADCTTIISTQDGFGPQASWAKEAAVKTISCEVLPGRTGSMLLSLNPAASVFAQTFFLKDLMARGFQRYYSIIVGTRERGHLLLAWDTISKAVGRLVEMLTSRCEEQFRLLSSHSSAQGLTKLDQFIRKRDVTAASRNLSELTGDSAIFHLIHKHFARLLTLVEDLLSEEVVGGQPLACPIQLHEERTQLFQLLCCQLSPASCRLLIYGLLSGRSLRVQGDHSDRVRCCLDLVLPGPHCHQRTTTQPAWATLSVTGPATGEIHEIGEVSLSCPACSCCWPAEGTRAACAACSASSSSLLVARFMRIVRRDQLSVAARHMRMVTAVAEAVMQARAWQRLRSPADKRDFLKKLGFARSDGDIFDLYNVVS